MSTFDNSQSEAIRHFTGPALILSGPGSGKTTVITNRIYNLIHEYHVSPEEILVVTFTRAAAREMKERFLKLSGDEKSYVSFGTFHSIFFMFLKNAYNYGKENIISESEKYDIITDLLVYHQIEENSDVVNKVVSEISFVKSDFIDIDKYYSKNLGDEIFRDIYKSYNRILIDRNKLDFDDMLSLTYELLTKREDILNSYRRRFKYILVDEFQDINNLQYEIVKLLAAPSDNLFVVGDDDQSIYAFRGAKPYLMKRFAKDYPKAKTMILDHNYRSTDEIIYYASTLIGNNKDRFGKKLKGARHAHGQLFINEYRNIPSENDGIIESIRNNIQNGYSYKDIAILYRTNQIPLLLIQKLMEYNIPFTARDNINNIYDHFIFKDIKAYIDISRGSHERKDYLRVINKPLRYVRRDCFVSERVNFTSVIAMYNDKPYMIKKLEQFEDDIENISDASPFAAIMYIRKRIGYDDYLAEYARDKNIDYDSLCDILELITEGAKSYESAEEWFAYIEEFKETLKKKRLENYEKTGDHDEVTLMTMHGSKGLEYPLVYIIDANEGVTPHKKALLPEDIEEERRLFYVAMTRAKESLYISYTKRRFNKNAEVSRFVKEVCKKV
ncbi:MAG TPA: ATP-dependent DNA helicase [Eubacterium sp.]|nr:ATP-dependent DNA helicase [Eubacterium sp.]